MREPGQVNIWAEPQLQMPQGNRGHENCVHLIQAENAGVGMRKSNISSLSATLANTFAGFHETMGFSWTIRVSLCHYSQRLSRFLPDSLSMRDCCCRIGPTLESFGNRMLYPCTLIIQHQLFNCLHNRHFFCQSLDKSDVATHDST